jgi:hypothetical protein
MPAQLFQLVVQASHGVLTSLVSVSDHPEALACGAHSKSSETVLGHHSHWPETA